MNYKEYRASNGKVLLNLRDFSYGNTILCGNDVTLSLTEVSKEDAESISNEFRDRIDELPNTREMVSDMDSQIAGLRLLMVQKLMDMGYDISSVTEGGNNSDIEQQIRDLLNE